jgi:hypothetical protein
MTSLYFMKLMRVASGASAPTPGQPGCDHQRSPGFSAVGFAGVEALAAERRRLATNPSKPIRDLAFARQAKCQ